MFRYTISNSLILLATTLCHMGLSTYEYQSSFTDESLYWILVILSVFISEENVV
ncbi:hypothetical protein M6B38_417940 [Iris pallida]|uniref:Uncharacterized protein n=1 Tax=Iris pallida TaxID=29817 RepID=A0AAX6FIK5_IRIPA|nr:hypothetical protein M6B38_417940 [Iris pallida]